MKLLVISSSGDSLPLCLQLQEEGFDIHVYIHNPAFRTNYEGMLKQRLSTVDDLRAFLKDADAADTTVIFDMTRSYKEDCEEDVEFLKVRGLTTKTARSPHLFGLTADWLTEQGFTVIGDCSWGENAEMDRKRGKVIAGQLGLDVPQNVVAQSLSGAIQVLKGKFKQSRAVLKPFGNHHLDCTYIEKHPGEILGKLSSPWADRLSWPAIIEEYIPGVTLDEEVWFDGKRFVMETLNSTLERKRFGVGDTGMNVGSSLNLVWMKERPFVNWQKLAKPLVFANYRGPVNATLQLDVRDGKAYLLEWAFRFGYDAIFGLLRLLRTSAGDFLLNGFKGGFDDEAFAATIRVSIPPYPYEDETLRHVHAEGAPVTPHVTTSLRDVRLMDVRQGKTQLECAGADGIVYVAVGTENSAADAFKNAEYWIHKTKVGADIQYRTDWDDVVRDFTTYVPGGPKQ